MTHFTEEVYWAVKKIPRGRVATYRQVAEALGRPRAFRAVGQALGRNSKLISVPCHRVVFSDGKIGGYVMGKKRKTALLRSEGVKVSNGRIDLKRFGIGDLKAQARTVL